MSILNLFKFKAYKQGLQDGKQGKGIIDNPYAQEATRDNLNRDMGGSPWWDTRYQPFIDWQLGMIDGSPKKRIS